MQIAQAICYSTHSSRLAWLTIGQHRLPISVLLGDKTLYHKILLQKKLKKQKLLIEKQTNRQTDNHISHLLPTHILPDTLHAINFIANTINPLNYINHNNNTNNNNTLNDTSNEVFMPENNINNENNIQNNNKYYSLYPKSIKILRNESKYNFKVNESKMFDYSSVHGMDDELAVVCGTLLNYHNYSLVTINLETFNIPIQILNGLLPINNYNQTINNSNNNNSQKKIQTINNNNNNNKIYNKLETNDSTNLLTNISTNKHSNNKQSNNKQSNLLTNKQSNNNSKYLNLSNQSLKSIDCIIIGLILSENNNNTINQINLIDNDFADTEGENYIAYALERNNKLSLDLKQWPANKMFSDGYRTLASRQGLSASGEL